MKTRFLNMITIKRTFKTGLSILLLFTSSCTEPTDFSQSEDLELLPVVETSLIFFEEDAPAFIPPTGDDFSAFDTIETGIFNDEFVRDNLIRADFVFDIENSINRDFRLTVTFADALGMPLEIFFIEVPASTGNQNEPLNIIQTYEGEALDRVKQSLLLQFELELLSGETLTEDSPGTLSLRSSGIFSLMIDTN